MEIPCDFFRYYEWDSNIQVVQPWAKVRERRNRIVVKTREITQRYIIAFSLDISLDNNAGVIDNGIRNFIIIN